MISISRAFLVYGLVVLVSCSTSNNENSNEILDPKTDEECKHCNVSFWVTKLTRIHYKEGTSVPFKLTADELIKRQRQGRFMQFMNYDELYFKVLKIDQPLNSKVVKFDINEIFSPTSSDDNPRAGNNVVKQTDSELLNEIFSPTSSDDNPRAGNNVVKQTDSELLGHKLSRVLVDEVTINFKPAKNQPIVLTANHAKILTDTAIMQFEGNVTLEATKCKISSEIAIWSNKYNGLYFSESFEFNNKTYESPAFFQITDTGRCQRTRPVHVVEYDDKLDEVEDKLIESIPMPTRLLLGLMGTPTRSSKP